MAYRKISTKEKWRLLERICQKIERGASLESAAESVGLDPSTVHRWKQSNEKIARCIMKARAKFKAKMRGRVLGVLAMMERHLGVPMGDARQVEEALKNFKIKDKYIFRLYVEYLQWIARNRLSDEFYEKRVNVLSGEIKTPIEDEVEAIKNAVKALYSDDDAGNEEKEKDKAPAKQKGKKEKGKDL